MTKIESRVKDTILQSPMELNIDGKMYKIAQPSVATLILVSEAVAKLPNVKFELSEDDNILQPTLAIAKDCGAIGEIGAILILGAKGLTEDVDKEIITTKRYLFGLIKRNTIAVVKERIDKKAELAQLLLNNYTPHELFKLISTLLSSMQIGDFFATTTFLIDVNILRQTKVETT